MNRWWFSSPVSILSDTRYFAADIGEAGGAAVDAPFLTPLVVDESGDERVLSGVWAMPAGTQLTTTGNGALVRVTNGVVTIINHDGELIYDTQPGDDQNQRLPAGEGLPVKAIDDKPVYLFLSEMTGQVWIVADPSASLSIVAIDTLGTEATRTFCTANDAECWGWDHAQATPVPVGYVGGVICANVRCWTK